MKYPALAQVTEQMQVAAQITDQIQADIAAQVVQVLKVTSVLALAVCLGGGCSFLEGAVLVFLAVAGAPAITYMAYVQLMCSLCKVMAHTSVACTVGCTWLIQLMYSLCTASYVWPIYGLRTAYVQLM